AVGRSDRARRSRAGGWQVLLRDRAGQETAGGLEADVAMVDEVRVGFDPEDRRFLGRLRLSQVLDRTLRNVDVHPKVAEAPMKRDAVVVRRLADVPLKANRAFELARSDLWMRIGNLRAASVFALTIAHLFPPGMSSYDCATALACQASPLE